MAKRNRKSYTNRPGNRTLRIEPLEDRRMLAVVMVDTDLDVVDFNDNLTSLREAIFATNLVPGADEIQFDFGHDGPATILLTQGELAITDSLTITGSGAELLTIDASGNDPTPYSTPLDDDHDDDRDGSRIFNIDDGDFSTNIDVALHGLTLTGGDVLGRGGAIFSQENLSVTGSSISGNSALDFGRGGGGAIFSKENLSVIGSMISGNWASSGGGIRANGTTTITDSTISDNSARFSGGGIRAFGTTTISGSTISGNSALFGSGGGIKAVGTTTITGNTISGNSAGLDGGGIWARHTTTITDSTISGNSAGRDGGGISAIGTTTMMINSTVSGNSAGNHGGGIIAVFASLTATNSTIYGNLADADADGFGTGGGISGLLSGSSTLDHTIVAGNLRGTTTNDDISASIAATFSLIGDGTGATIADSGSNLIGTSVAPIDPLLGPLQNNGGPTLTHVLLPGSPAINRGDLSAIAGAGGVPEFDQRGDGFNRTFSGRIDIGAFELQEFSDLNLLVDTLVDESDGDFSRGDLSLREAIELANANPVPDTIRFDPLFTAIAGPLPATILLTMGELAITDSVEIIGLGAELLTIDASGNDPTPDENNGDGSRVFNIDDHNFSMSTNVEIRGLTLTGGDSSNVGGAIASSEELLLADSIITNNFSSFSGGGIFADSRATTTLNGVSVTGNRSGLTASRRGQGGGVTAFAALTLIDTDISENFASDVGGGMFFINRGLGGSLTVTGSTFSNNHSERNGGGIYARTFRDVDVTITNSLVSSNSTTSFGAGIYAATSGGTIDFSGLTVLNNHAEGFSSSDNPSGGGLFARAERNGHIRIAASTVSGNMVTGEFGSGAGIEVVTTSGATAEITDNMVHDNTNDGKHEGGAGIGLFAFGESLIELTKNRIFSNTLTGPNRYGAGLYVRNDNATVVIGNSAIDENAGSGELTNGGGVALVLSNDAVVTIARSTISGNSTGRSGGGVVVYNDGSTLEIAGSTISGNESGDNGGGVFLDGSWNSNSGTNTIAHSTLAHNIAGADETGFGFGGGLFVLRGDVAIDHTVVAQNTDNLGVAPDVTGLLGAVLDAHSSLIGDNTGSGLAEAPVGAPDTHGNLIGGPIDGVIDPLLGPLANNGGSTLTHALLPGSPAIDSGDSTLVAGVGDTPEFDQRGAPFGRVVGGRIDIGALESQPIDGTLDGDFDSDGDTDGSDFLAWQRGFGAASDATQADGDATGDRDVDNNDLAVWEATFGNAEFGLRIVESPVAERAVVSSALVVEAVSALFDSLATEDRRASAVEQLEMPRFVESIGSRSEKVTLLQTATTGPLRDGLRDDVESGRLRKSLALEIDGPREIDGHGRWTELEVVDRAFASLFTS